MTLLQNNVDGLEIETTKDMHRIMTVETLTITKHTMATGVK